VKFFLDAPIAFLEFLNLSHIQVVYRTLICGFSIPHKK